MKLEKINEFVSGVKTFVEFCKGAEITRDNIDTLCQLDESLNDDVTYMKKIFGPISLEELVEKLKAKNDRAEKELSSIFGHMEMLKNKSYENWGLKDGKPIIIDEPLETETEELVAEPEKEEAPIEEESTLPGFDKNDCPPYIEKKVIEFLNEQTDEYLSINNITDIKDAFLAKNPNIRSNKGPIRITRGQFVKIFADYVIPGEVWKAHPRCSTVRISSMGRVKELRNGNWELLTALWIGNKGNKNDAFRIVKVKSMSVHNPRIAALVLETFAPTTDNNKIPGFKNENWRDCRLSNLYWKDSKRGRKVINEKAPEPEKVVETSKVVETPDDMNTAKMDEMIQNGYDITDMFVAVKDINFGIKLFKRKRELKVELRNKDLLIPILQFIKKPDGTFRTNQEIQTAIYKEYGKLMISNTIIDKIRDKKMYSNISEIVF